MSRIVDNAGANVGYSVATEASASTAAPANTRRDLSGSASKSKPRPAMSAALCGLMPRRKETALSPRANPETVSSGAQHLGRLDANGKFVATGNWDGPHAEALPEPVRTKPLQQHEIQQAGYQLGARLTGNPVDDADDRKGLAEATETIHQTRLEMRYGRGNIAGDVQATNGEGKPRTKAAYLAAEKYGSSVGAGVSLALGAGNCDQHGAINARRHASTMEPGGKTQTVSSHNFHHTYALHNPPPGHRAGTKDEQEVRPTVVLDSWASGPAVRFADSAWTSDHQNTYTRETFDNDTGPAANALMEQAKAEASYTGFFGHRTPLYQETRANVRQYRNNPPNYNQFADGSVVDPRFAHEAKQKLGDTVPLHKDILAAGAARQSYNLSVAEATKRDTLDPILDEAGNLTGQSRPPIGSR